MRSAKTDAGAVPTLGRVRRRLAWFQQLNARLVLALASVALVALLVSGLSLNQVLPGYFEEQAASRARTAALGTHLLLKEQVERVRTSQPQLLTIRELREAQLLRPVAETAAKALAQGTVSFYNEDGTLAARAEPDAETRAALLAEDLQPDPDVPPQSVLSDPISMPDLSRPVTLTITVSDLYTSRARTLERVRGTLYLTGLLALIASVAVGGVAARAQHLKGLPTASRSRCACSRLTGTGSVNSWRTCRMSSARRSPPCAPSPSCSATATWMSRPAASSWHAPRSRSADSTG